MKKTQIEKIYENYEDFTGQSLLVCGWIRSLRSSKNIGFITLGDGSCHRTLQIVFKEELKNFDEISRLGVGSSIGVTGILVATPKAKQPFELHANNISIYGESPSDYPLQKKKHSLEFLRTIAHLRPRTNTFLAVFRIRSNASLAMHRFLQEDGFNYIHTPIITSSDAEGAGEVFTVTDFNLEKIPKTDQNEKVDFSKDFFGKHAMLTVSGQLQAECMAMALSKVYTFGPTFRAENSNTQRHAAEFWMLEPEVAFANLNDMIELSSRLVKYVVKSTLESCEYDLEFLAKTYDESLISRLEKTTDEDFEVIDYTKAIDLLLKSGHNFEYGVEWGRDLQTEHEKYLSQTVFGKPIFVTDYPKDIKAFYMRQNGDGKTVAAMDMLFPSIGEIVGGSQREERLDILCERIKELGLKEKNYWWYLDLRRYGSVEHAGFGLGFERLIMYLTSLTNIRDVLLFPRTVKNADF
ncbi:MAG: asparagine--tRNA ligase [Oscillospiraceae bacterium]|nr:asparagine--tRNA ligase [Oscillospiraceae bacterium]